MKEVGCRVLEELVEGGLLQQVEFGQVGHGPDASRHDELFGIGQTLDNENNNCLDPWAWCILGKSRFA
jgi:hypothetical protein